MDKLNKKRILFLVFVALLLVPALIEKAVSGEQILHSKIKSISPEKTDGQYCFVKVEIKQVGDTIVKEEILSVQTVKKA